MRISKILFSFITLGISAAIGSYYVLGNQQNEGTGIDNLSDVVKTKGNNDLQLSKIESEVEDKKNVKWKLLFSSIEKKEDGTSHFFLFRKFVN